MQRDIDVWDSNILLSRSKALLQENSVSLHVLLNILLHEQQLKLTTFGLVPNDIHVVVRRVLLSNLIV